jgi:hypothetical protein
MTATAKHSTAATTQTAKASDGTLSEILMPSGATKAVKPPPSPPTQGAVEQSSSSSSNSVSFLQWSADPEKRIAFIRINGGPMAMAHEGDTIGGYTVVEIRQNAVELKSGETHMTLRTPH